MTLWPLSSEQIRALHAGRAMKVSFQVARERWAGVALAVAPRLRPVEAVISGVGFLQAVKVSAGGS